jgi:hypothetical protein
MEDGILKKTQAPIILWTIQTPEAVEILQGTGMLVTDVTKTDDDFRDAYRWLATQMRQRIGKPPVATALPLWAWHTWQGGRARPDLRSAGHLPPGSHGARIEFAIDPGHVRLTDFELSHYVLNYHLLPVSMKDDRAFDQALKIAGFASIPIRSLPDPRLHQQIRDSWVRIFDLDLTVRGVTHARADRCIQATFWALPLKSVRKIIWFKAR